MAWLIDTLGMETSIPSISPTDRVLQRLHCGAPAGASRGVVFVSVFNGRSLEEQGRQYYESIEGSVGPVWAFDQRAFLSKFGVYSRWLFPVELQDLMAPAGMDDAAVLTEEMLKAFPDYDDYIDVARQDRYKRRALIGAYSRGLDVEVT